MADAPVYVVADFWRVKPGREAELEAALIELAPRFRAQPGVLSTESLRVEGDPGRYLVIFRYDTPEARTALVNSDLVRETAERLSDLWDLDGSIYQGSALG